MSGHAPGSSHEVSAGSAQAPAPDADSVPQNRPIFVRRFTTVLRKLSFFGPLAAAYASFQAVLSSLPPSLSYDNMHYILAVISGCAAGGLVGCAVLLARGADLETRIGSPISAIRPSGNDINGSIKPSGTDVAALSKISYQNLIDTLVSFDDPKLGRLTGWPHFFHEAIAGYRPTAYGTAYGLKLALAIGDQDGRLNRAELADTLWKLRLPDGGWASRTQGVVGRPEVTALVLGALTAAGSDSARLTEAADVLESMLVPAADPAAMTSTFVISSILREFVRIRPQSPKLEQLRTALLNGAVHDPAHGGMICWSATLGASQSKVPSAAHTALAVVALGRFQQVSGEDNQSRFAVQQAISWLTLNRKLDNQTEQIRRFVTADRWESLTVNFYTAAWTARALMAMELDDISGASLYLDESIQAMTAACHDGRWQWDDGNCPLWMSYQGISTLRAFALTRRIAA